MLATPTSKISALFSRRTAFQGIDLPALLILALFASMWTACDDVPAPQPPPAPSSTAAPAPTPKETAEPAKSAESPEKVADEDAPTAAAPAAALPAADAVSERQHLLAHYRTLHCLNERGAGTDEIAASFEASKLDPAAWQRALDAVLDEMTADPDGELARALMSAHTRPCTKGGAP